jgi:hypothetical protein
MSDPKFVGYIPEPDVHDGTILRVQRDGASARVLVKAYDGHLYAFKFEGVQSLKSFEAEGMMLYSLTEMTAVPPLRQFVFTNWDEEADGVLDLVALDITSREIAAEAEF